MGRWEEGGLGDSHGEAGERKRAACPPRVLKSPVGTQDSAEGKWRSLKRVFCLIFLIYLTVSLSYN